MLVPGAELQVSRQIKMDLAFHLVAVHCNLAMFEPGWPIAEMVEYHQDEHFGPCGLRHHPYGDLTWTAEKLEEVLEEAEAEYLDSGHAWYPETPEVVSAAVAAWEAKHGTHENPCLPGCPSVSHGAPLIVSPPLSLEARESTLRRFYGYH